jgi:hypothetical protein
MSKKSNTGKTAPTTLESLRAARDKAAANEVKTHKEWEKLNEAAQKLNAKNRVKRAKETLKRVEAAMAQTTVAQG